MKQGRKAESHNAPHGLKDNVGTTHMARGPGIPAAAHMEVPSTKPKGAKLQSMSHHPLATGPPPSRGGGRSQPHKSSTASSFVTISQSSVLHHAQAPYSPSAPAPHPVHHAMRSVEGAAWHSPHSLHRPLTPSSSQPPFSKQSLISSRLSSPMPHAPPHAPVHAHQPHKQAQPVRSMHAAEGCTDHPGSSMGRPCGTLARPGSRSGRPTPPPSLNSTWASASPRTHRHDPHRGAPQRPLQLSARRCNPLASSSRLGREQVQPPPTPPRTPLAQPSHRQQHEAGFDMFAGPSSIPAFGGSLATSSWAMNRGSSASGGPRPHHVGMREAGDCVCGPNVFENDGRPGTRGGGTMYDLEGRPLTRGGGRPPSRMQLSAATAAAAAAACSSHSPPLRTADTAALSSTAPLNGPLTTLPRTYASVASSHHQPSIRSSSIPAPPSHNVPPQTHPHPTLSMQSLTAAAGAHKQHSSHVPQPAQQQPPSHLAHLLQPHRQQLQQQQQQKRPERGSMEAEDVDAFVDRLLSDDEDATADKCVIPQDLQSWMDRSKAGLERPRMRTAAT